jgi:hypothetical protein
MTPRRRCSQPRHMCATAGLFGEIVQPGPGAAANGADDAPTAIGIFPGQAKAKPARRADDQSGRGRG